MEKSILLPQCQYAAFFTLSNCGDLDAAKDIMEKYILWLIDRGPTIPAVEQQKIREIIIEIIKRENQPVKLN